MSVNERLNPLTLIPWRILSMVAGMRYGTSPRLRVRDNGDSERKRERGDNQEADQQIERAVCHGVIPLIAHAVVGQHPHTIRRCPNAQHKCAQDCCVVPICAQFYFNGLQM